VWSQPARPVHNDKCEEGGDCIIAVYFHGKLDFKPVQQKGANKSAGNVKFLRPFSAAFANLK